MANEVKKSNREAVRKAIAARKVARKAEKAASYEKMRATAKAPQAFAAIIAELVAKTARQADSFEALQHNLGLTRIAKDAPAKARVAAARQAQKFVRIAEEQPDVLADALREAYKGLDEEAAAIELAAEALGIELGASPAEKAFTDEGKHELELGEDKGEEVAESETPNFEAEEETEAQEDVEEDKAASSGSDGFVTDRDSSGSPKAPTKAVIPQSQGASEVNKAGSKKRGTEQPRGVTQQFSVSEHEVGADQFVKEIPQSQGASEGNKTSAKVTPTGKAARGSL